MPGGRNDDLGEQEMELNFSFAQNSWGVEYGNKGYCRISLPEDRGFDIFWPLSW